MNFLVGHMCPFYFYFVFHFSFHPTLALLATASGQRSFPPVFSNSSEEEEDGTDEFSPDVSLQFWWLGA